jgi:hypothetical protein
MLNAIKARNPMSQHGPSRRAILIAAAAAISSGSARAEDGMAMLFREGRYLPRYVLGETGPGLSFAQFAAFVGDEQAALAGSMFPQTAVESLSEDAKAENAIDRSVREAAGRRVVMLNEAHNVSRHRMFLIQLLRALRPLGFTHLAAETFRNDGGVTDGAAQFDVAGRFEPNDGTYSWDPVFAETVREAADLGYGFIGYEQRPAQRGPDGGDRIAVREAAQATNLLGALNTLPPNARIVVHVGFSHLRETPDRRNNVWLAARFRALSGLDPLTIEQSTTGSFGPFGKNPETTKAVLDRFPGQVPIIVQDGDNVLGAVARGADLTVFHPTLPAVSGRPGWLAADPGRRPVRVALPEKKRPGIALVQAVHAKGAAPQVPADQYLLEEGARRAILFLRPGRYLIRMEALDGFHPVTQVTVA